MYSSENVIEIAYSLTVKLLVQEIGTFEKNSFQKISDKDPKMAVQNERNSDCVGGSSVVVTYTGNVGDVISEQTGDGKYTNRAKWGNSLEFLMSCIVYSVGLGNVWRFPYTAYENGGGAFLIAYLIVLVIGTKPLYYMESLIGQFTSRSCIKMWSMSPAFKGIGYGMMISVFLVQSYYSSLTALILYYLVASFKSPLPWTICRDEWDEECFPASSINNTPVNDLTNAASSSQLFFLKTVLKEESIQEGLGIPSWELVLCLFVCWMIIFVIVFRGIKGTGKAAYFLALFPYVIMIGLVVRTMMLDGAVDGIVYLISPDWNTLINPSIWYAAVTQSFFSLGMGTGGVITYCSHNDFHHNIMRDVMIISILDLCTSLLAGATIFGVLGNLAYELGRNDFDTLVESGTGLVFILYPEALSKFSTLPSLFAVLFFLMLFVLSIGTCIALCNIMISVITDQSPTIPVWKVMSIISVAGFCVGISYSTPAGQYMVSLVDFFAGTFIVMVMATVEVIAISWVYGVDNFIDDMEFMTGKRPSTFWRICWGWVTPVGLLGIFISFLVSLTPLKYNNEYYPTLIYAIGWSILALGIAPSICFFIVSIKKNRPKPVINIFRPADDWGPANLKERAEWKAFKELRQQQRLGFIQKG